MAKMLSEFIKKWSFEQLQKKKTSILHSIFSTDVVDRTPVTLTGLGSWARTGCGLVLFRSNCGDRPTPR